MFLLQMREAWKLGISPNEFRKCYVKDLFDIWQLNTAFGDKAESEKRVQELMQQMKGAM